MSSDPLYDLTVVQLKELAKKNNLPGYSKLRKTELVDLIRNNNIIVEEKEIKTESKNLIKNQSPKNINQENKFDRRKYVENMLNDNQMFLNEIKNETDLEKIKTLNEIEKQSYLTKFLVRSDRFIENKILELTVEMKKEGIFEFENFEQVYRNNYFGLVGKQLNKYFNIKLNLDINTRSKLFISSFQDELRIDKQTIKNKHIIHNEIIHIDIYEYADQLPLFYLYVRLIKERYRLKTYIEQITGITEFNEPI
jgi:hypothetical protein